MSDYIIKQKSVSKSSLLEKNSLSAFSFRTIVCQNKNIKPLSSLLNDKHKGFEPGSDSYIKQSNNFFIRISDLNDSDLTFRINENTIRIQPFFQDKPKIKSGDICYQTASNVGNVCIYKGPEAFFNSHIIKLSFKEKENYIFSILKSEFGKSQVEVSGSIKGVDNFNESLLLNTLIPFPTTKNYKNPKLIEIYISVLTQNIIDKEEQIEKRQGLIDELIYFELSNNQKTDFKYNLPRKNDLLAHNRIDTGLYTKKYKKENHLIENYKGGFFQLPVDKFKSGSTPKVRIFNGTKYKYQWVTPTNITDEGFFVPTDTISTPKTNNLNKDCILFINRTSKGKKGEYVGITCFYDFDYYGVGQHNQGLYRVDYLEKNDLLFISAFMNSKIMRKLCGNISTGSKMKEMKSYDFATLKYPNFNKKLKQKITDLFYFKKTKPEYQLNNYLEKEKKRNKDIGIFQLNTEIIELKEILSNTIDKIIKDEKIKIKL